MPQTEQVDLVEAKGRVFSEGITARCNTPLFDNAAMDGYALCLADLTGQGPWTLPVSGRLAAGQAPVGELPMGTAMRILTGAPVPEGADAVIMQEQVIWAGNRITIAERPAAGMHIRPKSEDVTQGHTLFPAGHQLRPRDIALAAIAGHETLPVYRKLRVAIMITGDEISGALPKPDG